MGVDGTFQRRAKTTEARNVKFLMLIPLTMYITTKIFKSSPEGVKWGLKGHINAESKLLKLET